MYHAYVRKTKKGKNATKVFDTVVLALGAINLFATLPQVVEVWVNQNAAGVSSISWGYYAFFNLVMLLYGVAHKAKPIIITYAGSTTLYTIVFIGSLVY